MTNDRMQQLQTMLEAEPGDTFVLYSLAQEHAKLGEYEQAIEFYDRTIAIDAHYCYAYFHKARCYEEMDDVAAACETLRVGLERAREAGDEQAIREIQVMLDLLE